MDNPSIRTALRKLGLNYSKYLNSGHWEAMREKYRCSGLPQGCLGCDDPCFELHHRTYVRLGQEFLTDLLPLCRECHEALHQYLREHRLKPSKSHEGLQEIRGWSHQQTVSKFAPFRPVGAPNGFCVNPRRRSY